MKVNLTLTFAHHAEMKLPINLSLAGDGTEAERRDLSRVTK